MAANGITAAQRAMPELKPDSLREVVSCPLCDGDERRPATSPIPDGECHNLVEPWRSMRFQVVECADCGTLYQRIRPRNEDIGQFYSDDYDCYQSFLQRGPIVRTLAQITARQQVKRIERLRPPDNNLFVDVGCGSGSWMELFSSIDAPWTMMGTEISADLIEHVKKLGFDGHVCDDSNIEQFFEPDSVGVVHMNHVIEHVSDPVDLLRKLRDMLVPGGIVVGQTPDAGCLERRLFGDYWAQWHLPRHLVIFDKASLRKHAEAAGLEVVALDSSPSGAVIWGGSMLKWWAQRRGRDYLGAGEFLHPYLMLLFAPLAVLQAKFASTSHMDFVLRKPA